MAIPKKAKFLLLAAAFLAVGGWWGYRGERRVIDDAGAPKTTVRKMMKRLVTPAAERAGLDRLEELRQSIGRKIPTRQEAAALWEAVKGISAEEVKSVLEGLPQGTGLTVNEALVSMLYYRWAQLEPEAAASAAVAAFPGGRNGGELIFYTIFSAWARRDADAAIRWGRDSNNDRAQDAATSLAASRWISDDPTTAVSRARTELAGAEDDIFRFLATKFSGSPEARRQFFALLAKDATPQQAQGLLRSLASTVNMNNAEGAAKLADEMTAAGNLPEEWIETFRKGSIYDRGPKTSIEWLEQPRGTKYTLNKEGRESIYRRWVFNESKEAEAWALKNGDNELVASTVGFVADGLLQGDWSPGRESSSAWRDTFQKQFDVWRRMDPTAADAWLATMPGDIRKLVAQTATPGSDAIR